MKSWPKHWVRPHVLLWRCLWVAPMAVSCACFMAMFGVMYGWTDLRRLWGDLR